MIGAELTLFGESDVVSAHAAVPSPAGFELSIELDEPEAMLVFRAAHAEYATRFVSAQVELGGTTHLGSIVLERAGSVSGRIVDGDGRPVHGATVVAALPELEESPQAAERRGPSIDLDRVPRTETDATGHYALERVAPGSARVWAHAEGTRWAFSKPLHVEAQQVTPRIDLELGALIDQDRIAGVVVDPDGELLAGVVVTYHWTGAASGGGASVRTDDAGRFEIRLKERTPHEVSAGDPQARWPRVPAQRIKPGTDDAVLRFQTADDTCVRVASSTGEPIRVFRVSLYSSTTGNWLSGSGPVDPADGRHPVAAPQEAFRIEVQADHHAIASVGPFDPRHLPEVIECRLEALPGLRGRVLADGAPIANAQVALHGRNHANALIVKDGFRTRVNPHAEATVRTDGDGRFHLTAREQGPASIFVEAEGHALAEYALDVEPRSGRSGIEIELLAGGAIEGEVLTAGGRSPAGVIVGISRGDGHARTLRVGPEGTFRFEDLTPGSWQVVRTDQEIDRERASTSYSSRAELQPIAWDCEVYADRTTRHDVDLRGQACTLIGRFTVNGEVDSGWSVRLSSGSTSATFEQSSTALDEDGHFHLDSGRAGQFNLVLEKELSNGQASYQAVVDLEPGATNWGLDLAVGRLVGEGPPPSEETELELLYSARDERGEFSAQFEADEWGQYELAIVPVGTGKLYRYTPSLLSSDRSPWELLAQPTVAPGETVRIRP